MSSLFGFEAPRAVLFVIAFALILALVVLFGVVFRKLTGARLMMPGNDRSRSRQPRLGIVDVYDLDRQRQLILLRRDNVEHLLLIGGPNDVVIETNIVRVAGARIPAPSGDIGAERFEPSLDQAPRVPQVEPNGRPSIESQLAAQLGAFVRRPSDESDIDEELSPVATVSAPAPAHPEPVLKPDAVAVSAPPAIQGLRAEAGVPPVRNTPPAPPSPPAAERPEPRPHFTPPPFQSRATPVPPAPPVQPPEPVRPPQPDESERTGPDAALLSDMAKQLEEALKRPASPVPPPPVAPMVTPVVATPVASPVVHGDIQEEEDDLPEPAPEEEPVASYDEPEEEAHLAEEPEAPEPAQPAPPVEPVQPPPVPMTAPLPPQAKEPAPAQEKVADPFSVEDIEAEFARLLGRPLDPNKKG